MNPLPHRYQQISPITDFMSTLQSVQVNPTELCNRKCIFCPRSDPKIYPNSKNHISIDTCRKIGQQLFDINYKGRIGFVGFGEPLLHPNLEECIKAIKETGVKAQWIEINTNGDFLNRKIIEKLKVAGCTDIAVSMYDHDDSEKYKMMFDGVDIRYVLRHHYDQDKNYNLKIVDRIGVLKGNVKEYNRNQCFIPFYKMFIDWDGSFLLCDQDWGRLTKTYNVTNTTIKEFWSEKLKSYRNNLAVGQRSLQRPCNSCDVNGTLIGKQSFNFITNGEI
jgi:radical SAM protein with 4Fe4S-binding SPASM domain